MSRPIDTTRTAEERLAHIRAMNASHARKWRQKNPLKVAKTALRYWEKRVKELEAAESDGQTYSD